MTGFIIALRLIGWATTDQCAKLLPLVLASVVMCVSVARVTNAQAHDRWSAITKAQTAAAIASMIVALPIVPIFGILAASLQSAVNESLFLALLPVWQQFHSWQAAP